MNRSLIDRATVESILEMPVSNVAPYQQALLHKSLAQCYGNYERLELLGDAVLGLVATEILLKQLPDAPEGVLTRARAKLVDSKACVQFATFLGLDAHMSAEVGVLEHARSSQRILSDVFEAWVGATHLDLGIEAVRSLMARIIASHPLLLASLEEDTNYKGLLQEFCQTRGLKLPVYKTAASGPEHLRTFGARVRAAGVMGMGEGASKQEAEMRAAEDAYERIQRLATS